MSHQPNKLPRPRTLILLWLLLIGLFASYGFFGPGHDDQMYGMPFDYGLALETAVIHAGIGFTLATCLIVSLYAAQRLRTKLISGFVAILQVFLCCAVASFIPPFVMICSGHYRGENVMAIGYVAAYTFGIGLVVFILFDITVLISYFCQRGDI